LLVFEKKDLQTIFGPKIKNGVYRSRYNHELDKEFNSPNALNVTKTSKLRNAGHMIRRPEDLPQKAIFRAKPNGRRNQGIPKSRWAIAWPYYKISKIGDTWIKSDFRFICGYFFVTGNHNKTENEILSFRTL
jgi:hypothetical protein